MSTDLDRLATEYWEYTLSTSPTEALLLGDHRFDDQMERFDRDHEDQQISHFEAFAAAAEAIDPGTLTPDEVVTRGVLIEEAAGRAAELRSRNAEFDVSPSWGLHVALPQFVPQFPLTEPEHAEAIIAKWSRLGDTFDDLVHRLRQGVARRRTPARSSVEKTLAQLDDYLAGDIAADPYVTVPPPPTFTQEQTASWRAKLVEQVRTVIRPAYERYRAELRDTVLPVARPDEKAGLRWLPDGEEVYARAIRRHTSLDLTPLEIHDIGREEISHLEAEYRSLGEQVLGTGDLATIYRQLRDDPELRFRDPAEIVAAARHALDRALAAVPDWFGRLPKAGCVIAEVPAAGAQDAPIAFYLPPASDGSRSGTYFVNTTDASTRTRYESEALAFHESVPGHHLQLAIAQELEGIPEFRKHALVTVFVEGWGLYTERLADEMGLYRGQLERMGMLSFDSWRAGRLVVDTGMHALGWSRQEAVAYLAENSPQALNNIETEVERYIGMPGQALGYMIGRREILRLRREAESAMGRAFDIKGFHDTVLGAGPLPLEILGSRVRNWIAANRA